MSSGESARSISDFLWRLGPKRPADQVSVASAGRLAEQDPVFGTKALGGLGGVTFGAQLIRSLLGVAWALATGFALYGLLKAVLGLRLTAEEEYAGADLAIHKIGSTPDREVNW